MPFESVDDSIRELPATELGTIHEVISGIPNSRLRIYTESEIQRFVLREVKTGSNSSPISFIVPNRYENLELMRPGAQGQVVKAKDVKTGTYVVLKCIEPFINENTAKNTLRELALLASVHHDNIICLSNVFTPDEINLNQLFIVTEFKGVTFYDYKQNLKKSKNPPPIDHKLLAKFVHQLLSALQYLHAAAIVHRDIKPSNIAIFGETLTILDFGLGRRIDVSHDRLTNNIGTRFYMAPEMILKLKEGIEYSGTVDVWAVGCVMAELILENGMMFRGKTSKDLWSNISKRIGTPPFTHSVYTCFHQDNVDILKSTSNRPMEKSFETLFPDHLFASSDTSQNGNARDLLSRMLIFDFRERWTAEQCLKHPYIKKQRATRETTPKLPKSSLSKFYDENIEKPKEIGERKAQALEILRKFGQENDVFGIR